MVLGYGRHHVVLVLYNNSQFWQSYVSSQSITDKNWYMASTLEMSGCTGHTRFS